MSHRRVMTAADYAALAICPSLIVLMITALVHFLILCAYRGEYSLRITYIMFMFIVGATGIARISIEFGRAHASLYAGALGLATLFVVSQFAGLLFGGFLVAIVWLLADRITFDCTVIDDARAASGEGLIGSGGLFGGTRPAAASVDVALDGTTSAGRPRPDQPVDSRAIPRRARRGHKPGSTVFYLALAALPLFGLGQFLLPPDPAVRRAATVALAVYLFATLTLLVVTSFLGLRRYLRQRGVDMPADVSLAWMAGGAVLTAVMLAVCFALPLPGRMLAAIEMPWSITAPDLLSGSQFGWGPEGTHDTDAAPGPTDPEGQPGSNQTGKSASGQQEGGQQQGAQQEGGQQEGGQQEGGQQEGGQQEGGQQEGGQQEGGQQEGGQQEGGQQEGGQQEGGQQEGGQQEGGQQEGGQQEGGQQEGGQQEGGQQGDGQQRGQSERTQPTDADSEGDDSSAAAPPPVATPPPAWQPSLPAVGTLIKALLAVVLIGVIALFLILNRNAIRRWLAELWALLGGRPTRASAADAADASAATAASAPPRPFASFRNPFTTGADPQRAVVTTFQALDAWARQHHRPRGGDETPTEFARRLAIDQPSLRSSLVQVADAYNRIVYGGSKATAADLQAAGQLWRGMQADPPPVSELSASVSS